MQKNIKKIMFEKTAEENTIVSEDNLFCKAKIKNAESENKMKYGKS